jgi:hypothetical protein
VVPSLMLGKALGQSALWHLAPMYWTTRCGRLYLARSYGYLLGQMAKAWFKKQQRNNKLTFVLQA